MGEFWDDMMEASKQIGEAIGYGDAVESKDTKQKRKKALEAAKPRRPANIDDASTRQQETDRLRKRQGVLANIHGGASGSSPSVATKQLLGS